jgi:hypothetical protein
MTIDRAALSKVPKGVGPLWLVGVVYSALLSIVWYRASHYGYAYPWSDDWSILAQLTGQQPLSWDWLLASHNEHRIPLPKLYLLVCFRLTGGDFRWMAFGNTVLLTSAGLFFNYVLSEVRGRVAWSDAIVPTALLGFAHVGHFWTFQALFVMSTAGQLVLVASLVRLSPLGGAPADRWSARLVILVGLAVACLSGVQGLIPATLLSIYLTGESLFTALRRRELGPRLGNVFLVLLLLTVVLCLITVAATLQDKHGPPMADSVSGVVLTASKMLVAPLGLEGMRWWPWTLVIPLSLLSLWILGSRKRNRRSTRSGEDGSLSSGLEEVRLGAVILTLLLLYLALGIGRGARVEFPVAHYALLGLPLYLVLYLWAERFAGARVLVAARCLVILAITTGWLLNFEKAFEWGRANAAGARALKQSVLPGASPQELSELHVNTLSYVDTPQARSLIAEGLRALKAADIEPYQCIGAQGAEARTTELPAYCKPKQDPN